MEVGTEGEGDRMLGLADNSRETCEEAGDVGRESGERGLGEVEIEREGSPLIFRKLTGTRASSDGGDRYAESTGEDSSSSSGRLVSSKD